MVLNSGFLEWVKQYNLKWVLISGTELLLQIHHGTHLFLSSSCDLVITTERCFFCTKVVAVHTTSIYKADAASWRHQVFLKR